MLAKCAIYVATAFVLAVGITSADAAIHDDTCGENSLATIDDVIVSGCSTPPCSLVKNSYSSITVKFTPREEINGNITVKACGILGSSKSDPCVPHRLQQTNACEDSGLNCPLEAGKQAVYELKLKIEPFFPKLSVIVKFELFDEGKNLVICTLIPAKIVDKHL